MPITLRDIPHNFECRHDFKFKGRFMNNIMYAFRCDLCGLEKTMGVDFFWKGLGSRG